DCSLTKLNQMRLLIVLLFSTLTFCAQAQSMDSVAKVLEEVYHSDQAPRAAIDSIGKRYGYDSEEMRSHWKHIHQSDSINLSIVRSIIDRFGWLSAKETSKKGNEVLFLVIQHADLSTQLHYLPILKSAVSQGKARAKDYAYLQDRINTSQGKFQVYGSQFHGGPSGNMHLYPIMDEPNVNKRRKKVGLAPLETYAKEMGVVYQVPKKDVYKNKIVIFGILADKEQKPLTGAEVYCNIELLATTDSFGEYVAIIDKKKTASGLTFKKHGYKSFLFPLTEQKDVYTFMFLLDKE
ncbi:MAG TPA: DUF6624 domain-containing protein, partial [Flavisolibacter sp.]|nr:DUF6624 domain-containing protein [Flavisolibacter sp.]